MTIIRRASLLPLAVLALGYLTTGRAAAAPTLLNGSFEAPAVTATTLEGGTDWTEVGEAFIVPNSEDFGQTPYGTQFLGLTPEASDSQTVAGFLPGSVYVLGFDFADYDTGGGDPTLTVTLTGAFTYSQSFTAPTAAYSSSSTIPFTSEAILFSVPSAASETITLANTGNISVSVDNVGLYGNAVAVPEPASLAAALLGVGAVAGTIIRRSRRV